MIFSISFKNPDFFKEAAIFLFPFIILMAGLEKFFNSEF